MWVKMNSAEGEGEGHLFSIIQGVPDTNGALPDSDGDGQPDLLDQRHHVFQLTYQEELQFGTAHPGYYGNNNNSVLYPSLNIKTGGNFWTRTGAYGSQKPELVWKFVAVSVNRTTGEVIFRANDEEHPLTTNSNDFSRIRRTSSSTKPKLEHGEN